MKANSPQPDTHSTEAQQNEADTHAPLKKTQDTLLFKVAKFLLLSGLSIILFTLLLALVGLSLLVTSQSTREWLVADLSPTLLESDSLQLKVNGLNSPEFGYWYVEEISFTLDNEKLFSAHKLLLSFDATSLLSRKLDINELSAAHIVFALPDTTEPDADTKATAPQSSWQALQFPFRLQKLAVNHLEILNSSLDIPSLQIAGKANLLWQEAFFETDITLTTKSEQASHINLQAQVNEQLSGKIELSMQEPSGAWLGKLLKLPDTQAVDLNLEVIAKADESKLNWELKSLRMPWQTHQIEGFGHGYWETELEKLDIAELALLIDQKQQKVHGWWQDQLFDISADLDQLPIGITEAFQEYIVGGQITASLHASGLISNPDIQATIQAASHYNNEAVAVDLTGNGNLSTFNLENSHLQLGDAKLSTSGEIHIEQQQFDLNIQQLSGPLRMIEVFDVALPDDFVIHINEAEGSLKGPFMAPKYSGFTQAKGRYKDQSFELQSNFKGDVDQVELRKLQARIADGNLSADGLIDWHNEKLDLTLDSDKLSLNLLRLFDVALPAEITANLGAKGSLKGEFTRPYFVGNLSANGQFKRQSFTANINADGDLQSLKLADVTGKFGDAHIEASGNIKLEQQQLDINIKELSASTELADTFNIDIPEDLDLNVSIINGNVKGAFDKPAYKGTASVTGHFKDQKLAVQSKVRGNIEQIEFDGLIAQIDEGELKASGMVDWKNEQLNLTLNATDIPAYLVSVANVELPDDLSARINTLGTLKGSFTLPLFKGEASASGHYQDTNFELNTALNSSSDQVAIENLTATFVIDKNNDTSKASIQGAGKYTLSSKKVEGKIKVHDLPYQTIELTGAELPKNLAGTLNADLVITGALPLPMIYGSLKSEGVFEGETFSLNIIGSQKDKILVFDQTDLSWNNTSITANGIVSEDNLDLHVSLNELKLTDFNKFGYDLKPGSVDLNFDLLGSITSPKLDGLMKLTVNNQGFSEDINAAKEDIVVTTTFTTKDDLLLVTSDVKHGQEAKGKLSIDSEFTAFLNWLIGNENPQDINTLPLKINAKGNVGLNWLNHFIDRDIQSISGKLILDTQLTGTIEAPSLNGSLFLDSGSYVNSLSQTTIENAQIELAFDEKSVSIVKAHADDGHKGTLNLNGRIALPDGDKGLIDVTLNLHNASLVRREDIEGDASGSIQLSGDFNQIQVKGDVEVYPFQIMLDLIPSDSIPEIEVSSLEDSKKATKASLEAPPIALDVNINVNQQAYIRGRGLDAELEGKLALTGTTKKPNYNGRFNVIRGTFELFAKTFKLEEGDVLFSNDAVSLFVQGRHRGKELTFIASLSGTMDNLKIELRTEPSLPEDEALSRLLFGKSVRNITPIQAIQLASAIQTLRGEGGGFDPLGKARELLNVDSISVESQETSQGNGIAVGVGKYITEGVYVELERTPEPSQPWKGSVEVELTPNVNLETTTGGSSGFGGVELQWKNDY